MSQLFGEGNPADTVTIKMQKYEKLEKIGEGTHNKKNNIKPFYRI